MAETADRERYEAWLETLALGQIDAGVINEPRVFWDVITLGEINQQVVSNPDIFRNGNPFPVKLTHMVSSLEFFQQDGSTIDDPVNIRNVSMAIIVRDDFYMYRTPVQVPIWSNIATAINDDTGRGKSSWRFIESGLPFILSARDTLEVKVRLRDNPAVNNGVPVSVGFAGFGMQSFRPYVLNSRTTIEGPDAVDMSTDDFRSDGAEPIVMTDMAVGLTNGNNLSQVVGDIRRLGVQIRQVGNGTNNEWGVGPDATASPIAQGLIPAVLLGGQAGRAVVHRFPQPLMLEPGEGLDVIAGATAANTASTSRLAVGFLGHVMVT